MKYIIAISDTHVGGFEGLCPDKGIRLEGGTYKPDKFQKYIWRCWRHFWDEFVPYVVDGEDDNIVVVHNGDVVDGNHHNAVNLIPNVKDQEAAAVEILEPIADKYTLFMVRGTEAHGDRSDMSTERVAKALGCEVDHIGDAQPVAVLDRAREVPVPVCAPYRIGRVRRLTRALRRCVSWWLGWWRRRSGSSRLPDVFVRSHRHRFLPISIPEARGRIQLVVTPGWQLRTPHVEKIDRMRLPHIGGVIFTVEDGRCQVIEKMYKMPRPPVTRI